MAISTEKPGIKVAVRTGFRVPMHKVISDIDRPPKDLVEKFKEIPTAVLSDVTSKYENTMSHSIKPVYDDARMAGTALTVKTYPGDNLMAHKAITMAEPGDILVIDANEYTEAGLWGELASTSCKTHGLKGTVLDGAVRDIEEIEELDYPVYARAVSPKGSYKSHPGSINVAVSCGGLTVEPGDIVVGDDEGVAIVKPENAEQVLAAAQEKLDAEEEMLERIKEGEYIYDINNFQERYNKHDIKEI
ncbi:MULTISPECIES: 4-carboxy-4-hydroxy-2-oxoadipate aldolase/oxaloacetate decarboxylase [Halostella]|uniref:4-carboxy-4-hydroxy-2-oxoadipate aldolase/oxaloacetate decarboxylase n=1 Tax=Halostella TaxID=1843185 RepID=UPI001965CB3A|nr:MULTISPECIES: 4-carboxy-4-hydroxy-2-oxoadipate aldolase/oxaloacetate decarboxylase [Halostella]